MYRRENDNELPPFWEKGKNRRYVNTLTNTVTAEKPDPIRGGTELLQLDLKNYLSQFGKGNF